MKVVILAGGLGTRLAEETVVKPKPMVEVGDRPILWHIMKHYAHFGFREFVVALGYKGERVKEYFLAYRSTNNSFTIELGSGRVSDVGSEAEDWTVRLEDTGLETNTGGRLRRLAPHLGGQTFMLTYGDGVADLDLRALLEFHRSYGRLATVTAVRPPARFGGFELDGDRVTRFSEKPQVGEGWINGGYCVLEPGFLKYLDGDGSSLERDGFEQAAADGELMAYRHGGFWQCMDTLRDRRLLDRLWSEGAAPWKVWT